MGIFSRLGERLNETSDQIHAQKTRAWCAEVEGVEPIEDCSPRTRRKVVGVVESIKLIPSEFGHKLEVQIYDGTDRLVGVWLGCRTIPGIDLGSSIEMEGTVGSFGNGMLTMINPAYQLLPRTQAD
jgi:hypothetical protein